MRAICAFGLNHGCTDQKVQVIKRKEALDFGESKAICEKVEPGGICKRHGKPMFLRVSQDPQSLVAPL
jgi:hypothetical protein